MKLVISGEVWNRINAYVQNVDGEVAGMGEVERRDDGNFYLVDVAIYDQEVTDGTADLSSEALAMFQTDLVKAGKSPKNWYLWWHSHNTFSSFFSTTDTDTIERSTEFDFLLSLVVNKKGERKARLDMHRPFRLTDTNIQVEVKPYMTDEMRTLQEQIEKLIDRLSGMQAEVPGGIGEILAEIEEKVRFKRPRIGFGQQSYLDQPYDGSWSKKRKKDGGVTTPKELLEGRYDRDELELLVTNTQTMLRSLENNGDANSSEYEELRSDLDIYIQMLVDLDTEEGVYVDITSEEDYGGDELGLPPLPKGYRYGIGHRRNTKED